MENFLLILTKPDNIPIAFMIPLVAFFVWLAISQGPQTRPAHQKGEKRRRLRRDDPISALFIHSLSYLNVNYPRAWTTESPMINCGARSFRSPYFRILTC